MSKRGKENQGASDNQTASSTEYRVGFGHPPLETRFKPGSSGNPRGRPKGRKELKQDLHEELSERITLREGDRTVRMTKQRALVKSTVARAIKGDARAQAKAFELLLRAFGIDQAERRTQPSAGEDEAIVAAFLERMK
ncbi:MAG: DUF5681 domain-containing protein [Bosea sp. (in: a-proteobacteria)]|nr:DUF5681 domain-containing protein [Bosea sp. (in: a-proteobacteria)]